MLAGGAGGVNASVGDYPLRVPEQIGLGLGSGRSD